MSRSHRLRWGLLFTVVLVLIGWQLSRPVPLPQVRGTTALASDPVPGRTPLLPWPTTGEAALAVPGRGLLLQSGPQTSVPIASLTKIMTAYVILRDHPLGPTAEGPGVTMS
ncbi:MAG: D-alanyl-D-alanine carboxypeptidase, partial [Acidimicrobiales bacterium]